MTLHRHARGTAGPAFARATIATTALLLLVSACSGSSSAPPTTSANAAATTTTQPPSTTSTAAPTSTSTTTTTSTSTTVAPPPDDEVAAAWQRFWAAWAEVRASEDLDPAPLAAVAAPTVVEGAITLFENERSSGSGPIDTEVEAGATVTEATADTAAVEDCVLLSPAFTNTPGISYEAVLERQANGWMVTELRIPSAAGCVPTEIAEAAIAAYEAFYDGWALWWDPPDPESPLLDEVLTDPQRALIVDLLEEHQQRGVALRGRPTTHPEVIEIVSAEELVILNCMEPNPDYGLYDLDTNERLPDVPTVGEGQRNLESAVMVLEGGLWKVSDLQGQVDFACDFAPTERGLPVI